MSNTNWMNDTLNKITENVFITIDLDVFDSSIMPSTGTPEPGGLNWYQIVNLIKLVLKIRMLLDSILWNFAQIKLIKALIFWLLSFIIKF